MIDYLKALGITAVELMPVHHFLTDKHLVDRGLNNYWGYNSIGFFAPEARYACCGTAGEQVTEFKSMVRALHREGIEVILDVVYNHTGEGQPARARRCRFRGIDNASYYRLVQDDRATTWTTPAAATRSNMTPSARASIDHGQLALLDYGDARRWLSLRSCRGAGARAS